MNQKCKMKWNMTRGRERKHEGSEFLAILAFRLNVYFDCT